MRIIRKTADLIFTKPNLVLIGNFDGLHLGHNKIIQDAKKFASAEKLSILFITFEPHPSKFFGKFENLDHRITQLSQKLRLLKCQYFQDFPDIAVAILPFNNHLSNIDAKVFVEDILVKNCNMKRLIVGYDFIFGRNREGDFNFLEQSSKINNFNLTRLEAVTFNNQNRQICSSSSIRNMIRSGEIELANQMLGYDFNFVGSVIEGKKLGRTIGFPTINSRPSLHLVLPKFGVYLSKIAVFQENYWLSYFDSITNFGVRPTVEDSKIAIFETHVINKDEAVIANFTNQVAKNNRIVLQLTFFLRPEHKFANIEALKSQIKLDLAMAIQKTRHE
jgi:riboflavin kinase/FMN adenylyltransferase